MFNALKYIRSLEGVGFKREQAEAQVQLVMDTYEENVATKADISQMRSETSELRSELKSEIAELRSEFKSEMALLRSDVATLRSEVKADMAELRGELKTDMSDMFVKFSGLVIGVITLATGFLGFLIKF